MNASQTVPVTKDFAVQAARPAEPAIARMEHRWGRRLPCRARVRLSAGSELAGSGRLRNVSMSGALLETALPLPLYSRIAVAVLGEHSEYAERIAIVVRREPGCAGVEWLEAAEGPVCHMLGCAAHCPFGGAEAG